MVRLTVESLQEKASKFSCLESNHDEPSIFGTTDEKALGTYLEHKFQNHLKTIYSFTAGNSAGGFDRAPSTAFAVFTPAVKLYFAARLEFYVVLGCLRRR